MSLIDSGIDYLTVTAEPGDGMCKLYDAFQELQAQREENGHERKAFRFLDYKGEIVGGIVVAMRAGGILCEARGAHADAAFEKIKNLRWSGNIPRLDVQATANRQGGEFTSLEELYEYLVTWERLENKGRRRSIRFFRNAKADDTVYVGSPHSRAYLCVYDAHAVHHDRYRKPALRYEARYKGDIAKQQYNRFKNCDSRADKAVEIVAGQCERVDMPVRFALDKGVEPAISEYAPKSDEKSLLWLENHVQRTVHRLLRKGMKREVEQALNLPYMSLGD